MKLNVLNRSFIKIKRNKKVRRPHRADDQRCVKERFLNQRHFRHPATQKRKNTKNLRPEVSVENIAMSADKSYMYCTGDVRSHGSGAQSNVVVAVEWLDEDQKTVNTGWQRIEVIHDSQTVPSLPNTLGPFNIKAPLDRCVKCVTAYAFSGYQL